VNTAVDPNHGSPGFAPAVSSSLLGLLEQFDLAWRSGTPPSIDDYLTPPDSTNSSDTSGPDRGLLIGELVKIDLEYRWRVESSSVDAAAPRPLLEDYLDRFPELGPVDRLPSDLIGEEYRARRRTGEPLPHGDFVARFPGRESELSPLLDEIDSELALERTALTGLSGAGLRSGLDPFRPEAGLLGLSSQPLESAAEGSRFQVVRPHARGGLGQVMIARDLELDREVALKEIHNFHSNRPSSRARFVREAEITGRLEHPGIVPVYGLGRHPDGRPFYAMRLIRGDTLRDLITRHHGPEGQARTAADRSLELRRLLNHFMAVCNTIAYAHSQGVLHRDLKPSNILIGPYGETLLVDWGLAKMFGSAAQNASEHEDGRTEDRVGHSLTETRSGPILGTPIFMSPEQFSGRSDQLGPAIDVYSLGATLYVLLTGRLAFQGIEPARLPEKIRRGDFLTPRQANPEVSPALEAVCLKAMALLPQDRYQSPSALADDVERWLAGEPVSARREPWSTRARRWLSRHRTLVTATAAAGIMALAGLSALVVVQTRAKLVERGARKLAEDQSRLAMEAVQQYHTGVNEELLLKQPEMKELRARLLNAPREFYLRYRENLERTGNLDSHAQAKLAGASITLGRIANDLGSVDEAEHNFRQTLNLLPDLIQEQPRNLRFRVWSCQILRWLGEAHAHAGRTDEAEVELQESLAKSIDLATSFPFDESYRGLIIDCQMHLGTLHALMGKLDQAEVDFQGVIKRLAGFDAEYGTNTESREEHARCLSNLGRVYETKGRYNRAERSYREAREIWEKLAHENPDSIHDQEDLASSLDQLAHLEDLSRRYDRAIKYYGDALKIRERLVHDKPNIAFVRSGLAQSWNHLALDEYRLGRFDQASQAYHTAATILQRLLEENPTQIETRDELFRTHLGLGDMEYATAKLLEAEAEYRAALAAVESASGDDGHAINIELDRTRAWVHLGEIAYQLHRSTEAIEHFNRAIAQGESVLAKDSKHVMCRVYLSQAHTRRAILLGAQGRNKEAQAEWDKALAYGEVHSQGPEVRLQHAMMLACAGKFEASMREADEVSSDPSLNPGLLYNAACVYGRILGVSKDGNAPPGADRVLPASVLAARAIAVLKRALTEGLLEEPEGLRGLRSDPDLDSLRPLAGFQAFLMDLSFPDQPFAPEQHER
jgi:serine/threonine-protein kinase